MYQQLAIKPRGRVRKQDLFYFAEQQYAVRRLKSEVELLCGPLHVPTSELAAYFCAVS